MPFRIEYHHGGIHLPDLGLWLDAADPQTGPERVFVSHAHSDHTEAHREVILSAPTAKLMHARIGGERFEHVLPFGQPSGFTHNGQSFRLTLLPAGHIFGSAMSLIEVNGESLLYTGDFKLRRGLSAEACEPRHADVLIMESTFGRPHYVFPPADAVLKGAVQFCREALDNDETPVLLGYSLGKSQELMCGLADAGLPLMLHGAVYRLTQIYENFGQCFPEYERYDAGKARGKVLLCPPNVVNSAMLRNLGRMRCAVLTGWAVDPNCKYRYRCDAAFALSDHADFPDLIEMVRRVQPRKVYTLHGFAADFARTLRELGYDAQALSEDEQLLLGDGEWQRMRSPRSNEVERSRRGNEVEGSRRGNEAEGSHRGNKAESSGRGNKAEGSSRGEEAEGISASGTSPARPETSAATRGSRDHETEEGRPHFAKCAPGTSARETASQRPPSPGLAATLPHPTRRAAAPSQRVGEGQGDGAFPGSRHDQLQAEKSEQQPPLSPHRSPVRREKGDNLLPFAQTCASVAATRSKLEKIRVLSEYLRALSETSLASVAVWFGGRPFSGSGNRVLQIGWAALRDALCATSGLDTAGFHQIYLKHSDLGETAFEMLEHRDIEPTLTMNDVRVCFEELEAARGPTAKVPILIAMLDRCSAIEAKFLVKIITGDLRIGLKEGLVEEAIAAAFSRNPNDVRQAHLVVGELGETALLAAKGRLSEAALVPFRPVKLMLASPEQTAADVWDRVLNWHESESFVAWVEDKCDGVRCQLHKVGRRVALYSRDLKEVTSTFQELADNAGQVSDDFVFDGEIVAMRGDQVLPFSELQKRLGRREGDLFMRDEVPIRFIVFDLLWLNGRTCLRDTLSERQAALAGISLPKGFNRVHRTEVRSPAEIDSAFDAARTRGNEGLMIKDPSSLYAPGRRGLAWLKLKKAFSTLDCVVIGAEYGHGKRSKVLSDYTFAVRDEKSGALKTIGKAYTGLTDVEIAELTQHFLSHVKRQHGRYFEVEPDIVLEIAFDRLQPSTRHDSRLAMRFPRIVRIRRDKTVAEIDTIESAKRLVSNRSS